MILRSLLPYWYASSKGLGAVVYQKEKPVAYASRALTSTQQKYAQTEKETLAIVFGTNKLHQFLFGTNVYKPGKELFIADALSRNYLDETKETLVAQLEVNEIHLAHLPNSPEKYKEFQKATDEDPVMQTVKDAVHEGWPKTKATSQAEIKP